MYSQSNKENLFAFLAWLIRNVTQQPKREIILLIISKRIFLPSNLESLQHWKKKNKDLHSTAEVNALIIVSKLDIALLLLYTASSNQTTAAKLLFQITSTFVLQQPWGKFYQLTFLLLPTRGKKNI